MKLQSLTLKNFRNITSLRFEPSPGVNFLIGKNAQGKTSLLEAIGYLGSLQSFRDSKNEALVRWESGECEITAQLLHDDGEKEWKSKLRVDLRRESTTQKVSRLFEINQRTYKSAAAFLKQRFKWGGLHCVVFNPSDHELVRGEPRLRRLYLNQAIASECETTQEVLRRFQRALVQRNALLKLPSIPAASFQSFTEQMVEAGARLTLKRFEWLSRLAPRAKDALHEIAPKQSELRVAYVSKWLSKWLAKNGQNLGLKMPGFTNNPELLEPDILSGHFTRQGHDASLELIKQSFQNELDRLREAELASGTTLAGPHRDDWCFLLRDEVLKGHGSQGEIRSALLALKLSEIELFREQTGLRPVLLLDDFSSELDEERREFLLNLLRQTDLQVFVTTTENLPYASLAGTRLWIEDGRLGEAIGTASEDANFEFNELHR